MSVKRMSSLLGATALMSLGLTANAGGLSPVVDAEDLAVSQLTELTTISGSTSNGAYSIAPEWSEELGASVSGSFGYILDEQSAFGLIVTAGERKREALVNFGLTIDAERQIVFSAGQLQEKLEYGTAGDQEWVKQSEFGLAYDATAYSVNAFHVDSETTDNFVGAKSTGVEVAGSVDLSAVATLDYAAGYERLQWDDASADEEGLTARLDVAYDAAPDTVVNVFADHNVSENQYGIGATWQLGAGNLNATYTYVDGLVGSITDDSRVSLAFTMPLGGAASSTDATTASVSPSGLATARSNDLLAQVMKRPEYLPQRVIVKSGQSSGSVCDALDLSTLIIDDSYYTSDTEFVAFIPSTIDISSLTVTAVDAAHSVDVEMAFVSVNAGRYKFAATGDFGWINVYEPTYTTTYSICGGQFDTFEAYPD